MKKRMRLYVKEELSERLLGQLGSNLDIVPKSIDQKCITHGHTSRVSLHTPTNFPSRQHIAIAHTATTSRTPPGQSMH